MAIAQNIDTGAIMMQGFINKEALAKTISSQKATFYSRSRSSLWTKGETSTNFIHVFDIFFDCDFDSVSFFLNIDSDWQFYLSLFVQLLPLSRLYILGNLMVPAATLDQKHVISCQCRMP